MMMMMMMMMMTEASVEEETGQEVLVAAEVAARPAADIADIGDMPGEGQIRIKHEYTGNMCSCKYKYKYT